MTKRTEGKGPEGSVAGVQGVDGCKLPPLPDSVTDPRILTPARLAAMREAAGQRSELAMGRMMSGNLSSHVDAEVTQAEYTSVPDPARPGFLTNGLPVLQDTSETVHGIRYTIPMWKPSRAQGGRVMKRFSRRPGHKGEITSVVRVWDPESTTVVRHDAEALCSTWDTTGTCADPRHRHSIRRNFGILTGTEP